MKPLYLEALLARAESKGAAFLAHMAHESARRVSSARALKSEAELRRFALDRRAPRRLVLQGFDVIAEVKFASPTEGALASEGFLDGRQDPHAALLRARAYAEAGACAISVLTEPFAFRGSLEHLRRVAEGVDVPVLRKDFLVETYQVWEARAQGADGVLLVARIVDEGRLAELLDACAEAGLFVVLEAFDEEDLERCTTALSADVDRAALRALVGVNNRDLATLEVDPKRCLRLAARLPEGLPAVAESGFEEPRDVRAAAAASYALALIGSALMRSHDPGARVRSFLRAGRRARRRGGAA